MPVIPESTFGGISVTAIDIAREASFGCSSRFVLTPALCAERRNRLAKKPCTGKASMANTKHATATFIMVVDPVFR
jgi:hypothetical protein